jgi:hypothetical protein
MANWYVGSTKWSAVAAWAASASITTGDLRRQLATPAVGNERVFEAQGSGTTGGSEPSWNLSAGATTSDNGITWKEVTGQAAKNGDGGGSAWAAPHARLANALASGWAAAGDTVYVSNNHAATQSTAATITSPGTAASPCNIVCVDDATAPPTTLATTGSESTTVTSGAAITFGGFAYNYGVKYNAGSGSNLAGITQGSNAQGWVFDACTFNLANSSTSSQMLFGVLSSGKDGYSEHRNCTYTFGSVGQQVVVQGGVLRMINPVVAPTGSAPSSLFKFNAVGEIRVRDGDLSKITGSIATASATNYGELLLENCKLNASASLTAGSITSMGGVRARAHNCDSGGTNYKFTETDYNGTATQETATIRTGGASDGTTGVSIKAVTTANANFALPFTLPEIVQWNSATGVSKTATIEIASGSTLTNADVWLELEYLGDASSPQGSVASSRKANILANASNVTSSSASWGGSPASTQKLQVAFTAQQQGPVKARVCVGKAGATVYVDPLITIS